MHVHPMCQGFYQVEFLLVCFVVGDLKCPYEGVSSLFAGFLDLHISPEICTSMSIGNSLGISTSSCLLLAAFHHCLWELPHPVVASTAGRFDSQFTANCCIPLLWECLSAYCVAGVLLGGSCLWGSCLVGVGEHLHHLCQLEDTCL